MIESLIMATHSPKTHSHKTHANSLHKKRCFTNRVIFYEFTTNDPQDPPRYRFQPTKGKKITIPTEEERKKKWIKEHQPRKLEGCLQRPYAKTKTQGGYRSIASVYRLVDVLDPVVGNGDLVIDAVALCSVLAIYKGKD